MCVSMKRRLLFIATGASTDDDASSSYSLMIAESKAEGGGEMDVKDAPTSIGNIGVYYYYVDSIHFIYVT